MLYKHLDAFYNQGCLSIVLGEKINTSSDNMNSDHVSNCWVSVWFKRLIVLPTSSDSQQGLSDLSDFVSACTCHKHLGESFRDMGFVATVAFEGLGVELTLTIPRHVDVLEPTRGGHKITAVGAVAIPFAFGTALSPRDCDELIEFLTHHFFYHYPNGALGKRTQVLVEFLLVRQYRGR